MRGTTRYTPETVRVRPIDRAKLNTAINEIFHPEKIVDLTTYSIRGDMAIIEQPKHCIIDEEFIGHDIGDEVKFYVYEETKIDKGFIFSMMPTKSVTLTIAELNEYLLPEVTLAEFTRERRGYNARICGNEYEWVKYLNK